MPKLTDNRNPAYLLHKQSGQAIVTLNGRDILLGRHGTAASRAEYDRRIAEWIANGRQMTVVELVHWLKSCCRTVISDQRGMEEPLPLAMIARSEQWHAIFTLWSTIFILIECMCWATVPAIRQP